MDAANTILRLKNARILVLLKNDARRWYASNLARESGLSYVYVAEVLEVFRNGGLIELKKEGKIRRALLTENGLRAANALDDLIGRLAISSEVSQEKKPAEAV